MLVQVLGPMAVEFDHHSVLPEARQMRQVLAVLLLRANSRVSVQTLARELWGADLPATFTTTIQTYVLRLRKSIATALGIPSREVAETILRTERRGYLFRIEPCDLDLAHFQQFSREGSRMLATGEIDDAADMLRSALDLWRGPAMENVACGEILAGHILEMNTSRMAAIEQRIGADLLLGRDYEVLGELTSLVGENPFNEVLHAQYMVALSHTGRRAEALKTYHQLRDCMVGELGLEPTTKIQDIHRAVLRADDPLGQEDLSAFSSSLSAGGVPAAA